MCKCFGFVYNEFYFRYNTPRHLSLFRNNQSNDMVVMVFENSQLRFHFRGVVY